MQWLLIFSLLILSGAKAAKILGYFNVPSLSHHQVYQQIYKQLSLRGHEVTVITPKPLNDPSLTNLTEINVNISYAIFKNYTSDKFSRGADHWSSSKYMFDFIFPISEAQLNSPQVQQLLFDESKQFDLVIVENYYPFPSGLRWESSFTVDLQTRMIYK